MFLKKDANAIYYELQDKIFNLLSCQYGARGVIAGKN